jgi:hypothetical protein
MPQFAQNLLLNGTCFRMLRYKLFQVGNAQLTIGTGANSSCDQNRQRIKDLIILIAKDDLLAAVTDQGIQRRKQEASPFILFLRRTGQMSRSPLSTGQGRQIFDSANCQASFMHVRKE